MKDLCNSAVSHSFKHNPHITAGVSLKSGFSPVGETKQIVEMVVAGFMRLGHSVPPALAAADRVFGGGF